MPQDSLNSSASNAELPFPNSEKGIPRAGPSGRRLENYERAHRMRLTTTFARVVFPRVPMEVVSHIVGLWAHVGYY